MLAPQQQKSKRLGFTLMELMVVIVIIAIVISIAVVAFGGFNRGKKFESAAKQFTSLVTALQDQAIFAPAVYGLRIAKHSYQVYYFQMNLAKNTGTWLPVTQGVLVDTVSIPRDVTLKLVSINGHPKADTTKGKPQIVFLPSSDMTSFVLSISYARLKGSYLLAAKNNGQLTLKSPDGKVVRVFSKKKYEKRT